jgi:transposase-like protein
MNCPHYQNQQIAKNGRESISDGVRLKRYRCNDSDKRFNEHTGTPMAQVQTPKALVAMALNSHTEGTRAGATDRVFGKSHSTILRWEGRLANQVDEWSPPCVPVDREVTLERRYRIKKRIHFQELSDN